MSRENRDAIDSFLDSINEMLKFLYFLFIIYLMFLLTQLVYRPFIKKQNISKMLGILSICGVWFFILYPLIYYFIMGIFFHREIDFIHIYKDLSVLFWSSIAMYIVGLVIPADYGKERSSQILDEWNNIREIKDAIRSKPNSALLYYNLGNSLHRIKQYQEAEEAFIKAIELDSKKIGSMLKLSVIYCELKRYDAGIQICEKAINNFSLIDDLTDETKALIYNNYGICLAENMYKDKAKESFKKAITLCSHNDDFKRNLQLLK